MTVRGSPRTAVPLPRELVPAPATSLLVFHYWPLPANSGAVGESYAAVVMNPLTTISVNPY